MNDDLKAGIVRILKPDGKTAGTGFIAHSSGLIATCAHVVADAKAGPGDSVDLVLYGREVIRTGKVVPEYWRDASAEDIAILELEESLPEGVNTLPIGRSRKAHGPHYGTFGFSSAKPVEGLAGEASVLGSTQEGGSPVLQLRSSEISSGFSGAPLIDNRTNLVVGMVVSITRPDAYQRMTQTSFSIHTETMRAVCPTLQFSDVCPYRGFGAFTESSRFFVGREGIIKTLLHRLRREPSFLSVLGPSGCGKSSVVHAGLIPMLREGKVLDSYSWRIVEIDQYDNPFERLAEAGLTEAQSGLISAVEAWRQQHPEYKRLVLVLDQFEELLINCSASLRDDFITQLTELLDSSSSITTILVMQDGFYNNLVKQAPSLARQWLPESWSVVPQDLWTLNRDELERIVREPANVVGLAFEDGLIEQIVDDALDPALAGDPERVASSNVLPILEYALVQLWERRREGTLTRQAYEDMGRLTGWLPLWADEVYRSLDDESKDLAHRILLQLVRPGNENQRIPNIRLRRPLTDLYQEESESEAIQRVVQRLTKARLLMLAGDRQSGRQTVEIIHDGLLHEWEHLRRWLREQSQRDKVVVLPEPPNGRRCPFQGREPFAENEEDSFVGRERLVEQLLQELENRPESLTLLGPSGSGKTSLIQAGVIPKLRRGGVPGSNRWTILSIHQYDNPFERLAEADLKDARQDLRSAAETMLELSPEYNYMLLILDQFEELLLTCPEALRRQFIEQLQELMYSEHVTVIIVIQDGFYTCLESQGFDDFIERLRPGQVWIDRYLSRDELVSIVKRPVGLARLSFEDDLLPEKIVNDVFAAAGNHYQSVLSQFEQGGLPQQIEAEKLAHDDIREFLDPNFKREEYARSTVLPILEDTLTKLWKRCQDGRLTHKAYNDLGQLTGAFNDSGQFKGILVSWAGEAFRRLGKEERPLARHILTVLARRCAEPYSQSLSDTCRPISLADLVQRIEEYNLEEVRQMVHRLVKARLLIITADRRDQNNDELVVEIIHPRLRLWSQLQAWLYPRE